jgi:hypothetical protein
VRAGSKSWLFKDFTSSNTSQAIVVNLPYFKKKKGGEPRALLGGGMV